jgi:protein TonB
MAPSKPSPVAKAKRRRKKHAGIPLPKSRPTSPRAWVVSGVVHTVAIALIGWLLSAPQPPEAVAQPIELVDVVTDAPVGDQSNAQDRPSPKQDVQRVAPVAPVAQQAESDETLDAPRRPHAAAEPAKVDAPPRPNLDDLLARREARDRAREAERVGKLASAAEKLMATDPGPGDRPQATSRGGSVDTGGGLTGDLGQRRILKQVQPSYPESAERAGESGDVQLKVFVTPEGRVAQVEVVKLSGTPEMDRRAVEALKRWRFAPLPEGSPAVTQWGTITLHYRLD